MGEGAGVVEIEFGSDTNQQLALQALQDLGFRAEPGAPYRIELPRATLEAHRDAIERIVHEYGGAEVYW